MLNFQYRNGSYIIRGKNSWITQEMNAAPMDACAPEL